MNDCYCVIFVRQDNGGNETMAQNKVPDLALRTLSGDRRGVYALALFWPVGYAGLGGLC
jgi:hypothetical protein